MVGQSLGHYRIVRMLGAGGMGVVYAADDTVLKRQVAIKILPASVASEPERRDRFEREALAIASLNHPAVVTLYSVDLSGEVPFLTMELVEGRPLSASIGPGGIPLERLLPIAIALADAVATAHEHGVIHRDLKPANVMLTGEGRVKVLDFGLAKLKEFRGASALASMPTEPLTADGRILGTVAYMSPEQAEGRPVDARSDIFSLGIVLYEMAVGDRPFRGDTNISILTSILRDTPPPITDRNPALPRELERIVRRCLVKDPRGRYQSAADLRNDLEELKKETEAAVRTSGVTAPVPAGGLRRGQYLVATSLVATIVLAGSAAGYLLWPRDESTARPAAETASAAVSSRRRIAVTVFENRTGDRALDSLGTVAAERLIQGLAEAHIGDPIPTPMTPAEARSVRAGVLITGVFDQQGDTLTIQARVVRGVDGKVLYTPEPVPLEKARAVDMLPSIHQDVKAFVDLYVQGVDVSVLSRIPILEAEREYTSGLELFGRDTARSLGHFQRALEIDPRFVSPRLFVIATFMIARRWDEAARATAPLVRERHRLSKYEQSWVDRFVAEQAGQHTAALDAMLEAERVAPDDYFVNVSIGASLLRLNRPAAALATFAKMPEPDWMSRVGARGLRLTVALDARHLLGDFEGERREAIAARHWVPGVAANAEARSLMALGRTPEALQVVDDLLTVPGAARDALTTAVRELRAHDRRQESIDLANRMVERYRSQTPDPATAEAARHGLAGAFYSAERWDEAQAIVRKLAQGTPDNPEYLGLLGAIAARRGERAEALRSSDALRRLSQPYLFGSHTMWRARIAALLGEHELAVDLLRDAIAQGAYFTIGTHRDMDLESLKTNAAFRELMRPKE